jgi:hypothetical protein
MSINREQVAVDIGAFLPDEQKKFLDLLQCIEIKTEPGKTIFDVRIRID